MTMTDRLRAAAEHYRVDYEDLADWYQDDLALVEQLPSRNLASLIEDYLGNRSEYRSER